MPLQESGQISLQDLATEFGDSPPSSISEFYAGGSLVPAGSESLDGPIPTSGVIKLSDFYGAPIAALDISSLTFVSTETYVDIDEAFISDITFKPDGTIMFISGRNSDGVTSYTLSTAWDISTGSYLSFLSTATNSVDPTGLYISPDGTRVYVCTPTPDNVSQYTLSTAWDLSTGSYVRSYSLVPEGDNAQAIRFKPDGTIMYVSGGRFDSIYQYDLSTAWDISTASFTQSKSVTTEASAPFGMHFSGNGRQLVLSDNGNDTLYSYSMSTFWDISTLTYDGVSSSVTPGTLNGVYISPDATNVYVANFDNDSEVSQYSAS